jgi:hypothetical protein
MDFCIAQDLRDAARQLIAEKGLFVNGRYGPVANPAIRIERDAIGVINRCFRTLGLDLSDVAANR